MSAPIKIAAFAAALALTFGVAFGGARAVAPGALTDSGEHGGHTEATASASHGKHGSSQATAALHGLTATAKGFTLVPETSTLVSGSRVPFRFRVQEPSGRALTAYRTLHERDLHLIVLRRDLSGFQHVHPTRDADGVWTAELDLPAGGTWRAFVDLSPADGPDQLTLGADLQVAGTFTPGALPSATTASTDTVAFDRKDETVTVTVNRGGTPVRPDPYLGARGHLVAIRSGDLGYAHVHPTDRPGPSVAFAAHLPAGSYRLFFDYSTGGTVTTATSTLEVPA